MAESIYQNYKNIDGKNKEIKLRHIEEVDFKEFLKRLTLLISSLNVSIVTLKQVADDTGSKLMSISRIEDKIDVILKNTYKEEKVF